jgi:hypothetical protein
MMNDQYKKMKNLFLRQSYIDAWEDYQRSIRKMSFAQWDYIVLTAYYIPDTASTGQILRELAEGMLDKFNITVICVVPSYLGTIEDKYETMFFTRLFLLVLLNSGTRILNTLTPLISSS